MLAKFQKSLFPKIKTFMFAWWWYLRGVGWLQWWYWVVGWFGGGGAETEDTFVCSSLFLGVRSKKGVQVILNL